MGVLQQTKTRRVFFGADNDALVKVIIINVLITTILFFIRSVYLISGLEAGLFTVQISDWFVLPADAAKLPSRPWTLITFMFSHTDIWSLIANMLWLWAFGYIVQSLLGGKKLVPLYIYGGIAGAVVYLLCSNLVPAFAVNAPQMVLAGANCSVMAIAIAATVTAPGYRIFPLLNGGIPLWILTVIYAVINFTGTTFGNPAAYGAELGAAGTGFLFLWLLNKGYDTGAWMSRMYNWIFDLFNPDKAPKHYVERSKVFYDTQGREPYSKIPNLNQARVDEILDKINQKGYNNLTAEEKDILRRAAEEDL
ncbi:rhomboid family intramembrane serine protease [Terrimonas sp.]|uniref:rhomboid family intramembrane serine protease n=1 Tax=Terrimonas sp. TaxID=1914338 RepID=UPI000D50A107|nr:rhomboid family intramembrane serine protease [Terrimonas sp.]PVD51584.1 rhomboid family intramembrane serine protease [Terrimonas sp.]